MGSPYWSNTWTEQLLVVVSEESPAGDGTERPAHAADLDDDDDDYEDDDEDFESDDADFDVTLEDEEEEEGDADAEDYEDEDTEDEAVSGGRRRGDGR